MHEGPARISKLGTTPLKRGMILSNEPGYYKTDAYGIRIENLELVIGTDVAGADKPVNAFETLTLAPIDRRLIDVNMLSATELKWLNDYHERVNRAVRPHLDDNATKLWLDRGDGGDAADLDAVCSSAVVPREGGGPSTPWPVGSIADFSGILGHPPSRVTTAEFVARDEISLARLPKSAWPHAETSVSAMSHRATVRSQNLNSDRTECTASWASRPTRRRTMPSRHRRSCC